MRRISAIAIICLVGGSVTNWALLQQPQPGTPSTQTRPGPTPAIPAPPTVEDVLRAVRADLQNTRAAIIAKNVPLTKEQAAAFWPLFDAYQKEQKVIFDQQLQGIQHFTANFQTIDDASSLTLIYAHLDRDARINALRQSWLAEFLKVLPARFAVRVMQIDRRISLAQQVELTSQIPLAY